jgi:hypothetical protein
MHQQQEWLLMFVLGGFLTNVAACCCCCLKSTFKSDYLSLVDAAGTAMAELLCSKQALAEVRACIFSAGVVGRAGDA